jgi:hypothetical protein
MYSSTASGEMIDLILDKSDRSLANQSSLLFFEELAAAFMPILKSYSDNFPSPAGSKCNYF